MPRKPKQPFISKVLEQLAELDSLAYKPMFGCFGLYCDSVFFAIVCGEELYFRTDERSRKEFVKRGMEPFIFRQEQRSNNYYRVPDEIFEDPKQLKKWALTAIEAQRSAKKNSRTVAANKESKRSPSSTKPSRIRFRDLPVLVIVSFILSFLVLHPPAHGAPKSAAREGEKVLELVQVHNLGGDQKLYLAKDAVRMEHSNSGTIFLCRAPFSELYILNPVKKLYARKNVETTVKRMQSAQIFASVTDQLSDIEWGPAKESIVSGFKANTYLKRSPANSWRKYSTLQEPAYPRQVIQLICAYGSAMPALTGVPLRIEELIVASERDGKSDTKPVKEVVFETESIKEKTLPDSLFTLPPDYKKLDGKAKLLDGTGNFRSYQDMMSSPDFMFQSSKEKLRGDQLKDENSKTRRKRAF